MAKANQSDKEVTRCTNFQPWLIVPRINAFAQQSLFHQYSRGRVTLITLKPDHYLLYDHAANTVGNTLIHP